MTSDRSIRARCGRVLLCFALSSVLVSSLGTAAAVSARPPSSLDYSPELDVGLLGEGRKAYRERRDHERARDAYRLFKAYLEANPEDSTAAWHFSLSCYFLAKRVLKDSEEKKRIYVEGRDASLAAIERDDECGPCFLTAAINHALWGREVGIFRTIVGLPTVRRQLKRAAELDPAFGGGAPYRILASIDDAVPALFGGGKKRARRNIDMAIAVAPEEPLNYEFLADLLLDRYKDVKGAVSVARKGLEVPIPGPEYVESLDAIEELQEMVQQYGGRPKSSDG